MRSDNKVTLIAHTVDIVASHVANNTVAVQDLRQLIHQVHAALVSISNSVDEGERPVPAVAVQESVTPDFIFCLEDGKKLKMLKRHIKNRYDLTPEEYRDRWGLPGDYPMVAPNYAKTRSTLAKQTGLGTRGRQKVKK